MLWIVIGVGNLVLWKFFGWCLSFSFSWVLVGILMFLRCEVCLSMVLCVVFLCVCLCLYCQRLIFSQVCSFNGISRSSISRLWFGQWWCKCWCVCGLKVSSDSQISSQMLVMNDDRQISGMIRGRGVMGIMWVFLWVGFYDVFGVGCWVFVRVYRVCFDVVVVNCFQVLFVGGYVLEREVFGDGIGEVMI